MKQLAFFEPSIVDVVNLKTDLSSTFAGNSSLPVHRWFRYSAGFSATWVRELIESERVNGRKQVFDPFAGSGTTLLEAEKGGVEAKGAESHPFVARIAKAKLLWREPPDIFRNYALKVLESARHNKTLSKAKRSPLLEKCFPEETLTKLESLRLAWKETADNSPFSELTWLAIISILRSCSPVGTAQWQYVLPNKSKARVIGAYEAFEAKVRGMAQDMRIRQCEQQSASAQLYQTDARECLGVPEKWADLVITSPPYANNYDYADSTRLEMTFMEEIDGWGDLQDAVRIHLIRSCTQHVAPIMKTTQSMIEDPLLRVIHEPLSEVCLKLSDERENHGGKKPYHALIAAYFLDMARVWKALRRVTAENALVCFVVGDSAPYGIHVPVERWLGELALASGFESYRFEKTRDRNVKWKNRKHRVPLQEGRLWVEG